MKTYTMPQYSPDWWEMHRGRPTSSEFNRTFMPVKAKPTAPATQDKYIAELISGVLLPDAPFFTERSGHTSEMRNGINTEPEARAWYMFQRDCEVREIGFCTTDDGRFGCSPDGLIVGEGEAEWVGALELKCPRLDIQLHRLLKPAQVPAEYLPQVHGQLVVTGLPWVDFMSYCPPAEPLLVRVTPNEYTDKLRKALDAFWERYQAARAKIMGKNVA